MSFNFRFSHVLLIGIAAMSVFSMIGFFNANAANVNMSDTVGTNSTTNSNMTSTTSTNMTGNMSGNMTTTVTPKILPPLQQLKSGITAQSVQCTTGFTLIFKAEDGSPACVTSNDVQTLVARGWGKTA